MTANRRFVLAGFESGKTVNKGGVQFSEGVYTHEGSVDPTPELAIFLERAYYAFPEGPLHQAAQERYEREQKSGKTETVDDAPVSSAAANEQPREGVKEAVSNLDHENDEHWDENGKPKLAAVSDFAGERVTRQAVELAAPGYNRAAAKAASALS